MSQFPNLKQQREQQIPNFTNLIGLPEFQKKQELEIALMHPSYIYELNAHQSEKDSLNESYRRLAHLGDAILGAIVTDYLYDRYPEGNKGFLTSAKQLLVDKVRLFEFAKNLKLQQFCLLGRSQQGKVLDQQEKLFAEMFEAVFGVIYLEFERDFSKARSWLVERFIADAVDDFLNDEPDDLDDFDELVDSTTVTTREYLDMIGLHDFPDYGWAPGDDSD